MDYFIKLPKFYIKEIPKRLSLRHLGFISILLSYSNSNYKPVFPSIATIQKLTGYSAKQISLIIRDLKTAGFIRVEKNKSNNNIYYFNLPKKSYINYSEYIKSEQWQKKREETLKEQGYKCQLCGGKDKKLNIHHNNYNNLGNEKKNDLIVLCENCHKDYHNKVKGGMK